MSRQGNGYEVGYFDGNNLCTYEESFRGVTRDEVVAIAQKRLDESRSWERATIFDRVRDTQTVVSRATEWQKRNG